MYRTCIFCNQALGENTVVEEMPVGRRLAFDEARGRLWIVCRKCERWNLSPIEERWEAIEACEHLFRGTRMRTSTDNIGLARHPEGLELVRIGSPQRPEFAAWRYGDQFGRRRKRALIYGVGGGAIIAGVVIGGAVVGVVGGGLLAQSGNFVNLWVNGRTRLKLPLTHGGVVKLKTPDLQKARLRPATDAGEFEIVIERGKRKEDLIFTGAEAERVAGLVLPKLNSRGARTNTVQEAVREIEDIGDPEAYVKRVAARPPAVARRRGRLEGRLGGLPTPTQLALEMALHEEQERRALQGELKALELHWKAAEEVAAIADDLLLPDDARTTLSRLQDAAQDPDSRMSDGDA